MAAFSRYRSFLALSVPLLLGWLLLQVPALAQSREEFESDIPDRRVGEASGSPGELNLSETGAFIVELTNSFRGRQELPELTQNPELREAAQYFAGYMARTGEYGHQADGKQPSERADEHGYESCILLENIAYRSSSTGFTASELARGFVDSWKSSPEHRENMLDPDIHEIGVAVAYDEDSGNYYGVQMFGRPEAEAIEFRVSNLSDEEVSYTISRADSEREYSLQPQAVSVHQRCRPGELRFDWFEEGQALEPRDGDQFVVRTDEAGEFTVNRQ